MRIQMPIGGDDFSGELNYVLNSLATGLPGDPQFKVLRSVIQAIAVKVMNVFAALQPSAEGLFHDEAVFKYPTFFTDAIWALNKTISAIVEPRSVGVMRTSWKPRSAASGGQFEAAPFADLRSARSAMSDALSHLWSSATGYAFRRFCLAQETCASLVARVALFTPRIAPDRTTTAVLFAE